MSDSLPNFAEVDDLAYTGITDTGEGFTGSSTVQDVQLGSPILLDSSYGSNDQSSVVDFLNQPYDPFTSQSLSGISDTPVSNGGVSTPTPNVAQPNANTSAGLSSLAKLGSVFAQLWAAPTRYTAGAQPVVATPAGASLLGGGASGTNTLIVVIVIGALVFLLLRSE